MNALNNRMYHLMAILTAAIWGTTFISTKVLLYAGITPAEIFIIRFIIAYVVMWILHPRFHAVRSLRDELLFLLLGIFGGSVYFLTENTALHLTQASNVALIVTSAPIFTAIAAHFTVKGEQLHKMLWLGASLAMAGVFLVVFNGNFVLKLNPLGDVLSLVAALSWAFYSVILKQLDQKYHVMYMTRKVFFYGILTMIPWFIYEPFEIEFSKLLELPVLLNLLFLGIIASSLCYASWNIAVKHLGSIATNNYIYFIPVITLIASKLFLDEEITLLSMLGALLILGGVYLTEFKNKAK